MDSAMTSGPVTTAHQDLTDWVRMAQDGHPGAFEEVMSRTQGLARKTAFPLVRPDQVDDAVQEAFLIVFQKLHHLQKPEAFQAWLSRIVIHACHAIRKMTPEVSDQVETATTPDSAEQLVTRLDLRSALQQLKEEERQVLVLREFLKYSYEEVAYVTRLPVGTVRSRLHYGRKKLAKLMC